MRSLERGDCVAQAEDRCEHDQMFTDRFSTTARMVRAFRCSLRIGAKWSRMVNQPVLLYGYGGFSVSLIPGVQGMVVAWLEMGGVYAEAKLAGGGE